VTLTELRARYRSLFYDQHWMLGERFMNTLPNEREWKPPAKIVALGRMPTRRQLLRCPLAVDHAHSFVEFPDDPNWLGPWRWCRDRDSEGNPIYVKVVNGKFEIHRVQDYMNNCGL
jgi:hypothetical protein